MNETSNRIFYTAIGLCMTHNNVFLIWQKNKGGGGGGKGSFYNLTVDLPGSSILRLAAFSFINIL